MEIELGTRVVRGLDWMWNDQDGEEGTLGTVIQIQSKGSLGNVGSAKVLWDNGGQGIYRCGENNACDLLVYSSPVGKYIFHHSVYLFEIFLFFLNISRLEVFKFFKASRQKKRAKT